MSKINKLGQYKNIAVKVSKQTVTQEEVDNQVKVLVARNPILEEKDGEVSNGDVTTIDFAGFKDGVAFDGGSAKGHQLEIGSGQFIPGFEEQMLGMKKGETRDLNLTFPENYGVKDLAGVDVVFKVTVHKIETKKEAELNDQFVASLNIPEVKTVADLYENMKANIQAQYDQAYQSQKENAIFDKILADSDVVIDDDELKNALEKQIQHITMQLAQQGMQLEQYLQMMNMDEAALRQQIEPSAKQQAIFEAVIDEIIKVENLNTTDEELEQQIENLASYNQISKEEVLKHIERENLRHDFNRVKASRLIIESAIVSE